MDFEISLQDWIKILHNAARVKPGAPRYAEARKIAQMAVASIRGLNQQAGQMDKYAPIQEGPDTRGINQKVQDAITGAGVGAMRTMSSGIGQPIAGALSAIQGKGFGAGEQTYREGLAAAHEGAPVASRVGEVAGVLLNPLARALPAPTTAMGGAVTGGVLGGIQGLAEGEGSPRERTATGVVGALTGAIGGAILGKIVKRLTPLAVMAAKKLRFTPGTPAPEMAAAREIAAETAVRTKLQKDGFSQENIEQLIQTMKTQGHIPTAPGPEVPVQTRPGETLVQTAPRGFEVTGTRATPPAPKGGSFWEQLRGTPVRDMGKGQTLPYYPRGGRVEQSMAPFPATSPGTGSTVPGQQQLFLDYLKGATPHDLPTRIGTLRDLGIPLPPDAEGQIFQMLFGAR